VINPVDIIEQTARSITPQDDTTRARAIERLGRLAMPYWALGRLMDLAVDLAGMTCSLRPACSRKAVIIMAADHGVAEQGVSRYPREVTLQMVHNIIAGGAGINALARQARAEVFAVDMGVAGDLSEFEGAKGFISRSIDKGTKDIARGPAMTRDQAVRSIICGIEIVNDMAEDFDVFATGDMGIGNTTPSAAIVSALTKEPTDMIAGRGTGIDDEGLMLKVGLIEKAIDNNRPDVTDGIDVLTKLGGFEIGGIAGVVLGAASRKRPLIIDGFISTAGAMVAYLINPTVGDYIIAAHKSLEPGHIKALEYIKKQPLLDLNMRLGEGTGAALAMNLVEAACNVLTDIATFEEAHVSRV